MEKVFRLLRRSSNSSDRFGATSLVRGRRSPSLLGEARDRVELVEPLLGEIGSYGPLG